jgi:hypothetical protein
MISRMSMVWEGAGCWRGDELAIASDVALGVDSLMARMSINAYGRRGVAITDWSKV